MSKTPITRQKHRIPTKYKSVQGNRSKHKTRQSTNGLSGGPTGLKYKTGLESKSGGLTGAITPQALSRVDSINTNTCKLPMGVNAL